MIKIKVVSLIQQYLIDAKLISLVYVKTYCKNTYNNSDYRKKIQISETGKVSQKQFKYISSKKNHSFTSVNMLEIQNDDIANDFPV